MFTPLLNKTAEPPPPEGVPVKEWDKILEKGPDVTKQADPLSMIRKAASDLSAQRAFEELTSPLSPTDELLVNTKIAAVEDQELFASAYCVTSDDENALELYERMGGTYKHAFGVQMFDSKQMAGSPAVAGGMAARARTPMPQTQSAPVSVTTTSIGNNGQGNNGVSAPSPTSTTSTPSAPTG